MRAKDPKSNLCTKLISSYHREKLAKLLSFFVLGEATNREIYGILEEDGYEAPAK